MGVFWNVVLSEDSSYRFLLTKIRNKGDTRKHLVDKSTHFTLLSLLLGRITNVKLAVWGRLLTEYKLLFYAVRPND